MYSNLREMRSMKSAAQNSVGFDSPNALKTANVLYEYVHVCGAQRRMFPTNIPVIYGVSNMKFDFCSFIVSTVHAFPFLSIRFHYCRSVSHHFEQ